MDKQAKNIIKLHQGGYATEDIASALGVNISDVKRTVRLLSDEKQDVTAVTGEDVKLFDKRITEIAPYGELHRTGEPLTDIIRGASYEMAKVLYSKIEYGMSEKDIRLVMNGLVNLARINSGNLQQNTQNNIFVNQADAGTSVVAHLRD